MVRIKSNEIFNHHLLQANWYRAAQHCRYHGMELASINNQEENDKLIEALETLGRQVYIFELASILIIIFFTIKVQVMEHCTDIGHQAIILL